MKGLTDKQRNILEFIESFTEKNGMSPTVYEIADHFRIKTSTVFAHIKALERKQYLSRTSKARSISLNFRKKSSTHMSFVLPIPLLGRINAGLPVENQEFFEGQVYCDKSLIGPSDPTKIFALQIYGESMIDAGIMDKDIVIVKQSHDVKQGDIVAALVENESTVKFFFRPKSDTVELRPANRLFKSQYYNIQDVAIQGIIIGLQRRY